VPTIKHLQEVISKANETVLKNIHSTAESWSLPILWPIPHLLGSSTQH